MASCPSHPDAGTNEVTTSHDVGPDRFWLIQEKCNECGNTVDAKSWREIGINN